MKNHFQTACERMTDAELAAWRAFTKDKRRGAAARLWVIESMLESVMRSRGLLKPKKTVSLDDMDRVKLWARAEMRSKSDFAAFIEGEKTVMQLHDSAAFMDTLRACFGVNDFFGDAAAKAARKLEAEFFKDALAAVEFAKAKRTGRKPNGGKSKMLVHIKAGMQILSKRKNPLRKMKKAKLRSLLEKVLGDDAFTDEKSWTALYKRREFRGLLEQEHKGPQPGSSGKGRTWIVE